MICLRETFINQVVHSYSNDILILIFLFHVECSDRGKIEIEKEDL